MPVVELPERAATAVRLAESMCKLVSECSEPDHHDETFRMMVETWFYEHLAELKEFGDTLPKYDAFLEAPPEDDVDVWALQHALDRGFNAVLFGDGESGKTMEVHKVAPSTDAGKAWIAKRLYCDNPTAAVLTDGPLAGHTVYYDPNKQAEGWQENGFSEEWFPGLHSGSNGVAGPVMLVHRLAFDWVA